MTVQAPLSPHLQAAARELADFKGFADILQRLIEIETAIHTLVGGIGAAVQGGPVVASVEATLQGMAQSQAIVDRMNGELTQNAKAAAAELEALRQRSAGLDDLVDGVRKIAKQTFFLSINASIEATRAGQSAGGFAVVAKEVRALSREAEEVSQKIGDGIGQLVSGLGETLTRVIEDRQKRDAANFADLSATFSHVGRCVSEISTHQGQLLHSVKAQGEALVEPINELAASIQFQDITRQQLGHVDLALVDMGAHFADLSRALRHGGALPPDTVAARIDQMYQGYVMSQQRHSHDGAGASSGKVIELF